jgi:hypothetical protein
MECFYRLDRYKKLTKMRENIFFNNLNTKYIQTLRTCKNAYIQAHFSLNWLKIKVCCVVGLGEPNSFSHIHPTREGVCDGHVTTLLEASPWCS